MSGGIIITGDKELNALLQRLPVAVEKKIARQALSQALTIEVKAMKAAVPANMKDARQAIGKRLGKNKRKGIIEAKAGAAVGFNKSKTKKIEGKIEAKRAGKPGVGISPRNIHWFILGTQQRTRGVKIHRLKSGNVKMLTGNTVANTGQMPGKPFIRQAALSVQSQVQAKIEEVIRQKLDQEIAKQ